MTEKNKNNTSSDFLGILQEYCRSRKEIIAAYLFGSFAADKATSFSDVDIALLIPPVENRMESFHARLQYQTELSDLIKNNVDIVLLIEAGEMLSYQILKFGRLVFERDRDAHRVFVAKRVIQCLDFQYYERIMQQGMVNAMRRECNS